MLSNEMFVQQSLELNLFFMRIAKEHSFFMEAAFPGKNQELIQQAESIKIEFTKLLTETITIADGLIRPEVIISGELVTKYTIDAERISEYYSGINLDKEVSNRELLLSRNNNPVISSTIIAQVTSLNQRAIKAATALADYKAKLLKDISACCVFTFNYPLLLEHILREIRFYLRMLNMLQIGRKLDLIQDMIEQEIFWNRIMAEHSYFIRGLLDPTEVSLFNTANQFGKEFDALTKEAMSLVKQPVKIPELNRKTLRFTENLRNFKASGTEGLLQCKIKSIIIPLLGDHVVREANHYLRLLNTYKRKIAP